MKPCPTSRRHVLAAAALALSAQCALAQSDSADAKLERVVITGSSIKRLAAETASPVQIVSRQEIKQTGAKPD